MKRLTVDRARSSALAAPGFLRRGHRRQAGTVQADRAAASGSAKAISKNMGHCNNIIIEMKDYLIVVDANFPSGARLAMADAKKVSSKPVKYVFDTHHHGDHAYGNAVWTEAGATTLAYKGVAEEMKRYEPARWQATAKDAQGCRGTESPTRRAAQADVRQEPVRAERRHARGGVLFLRLGAHARRRLRLPAEGKDSVHGRRGGQRTVQLHRGRERRQLAESGPGRPEVRTLRTSCRVTAVQAARKCWKANTSS